MPLPRSSNGLQVAGPEPLDALLEKAARYRAENQDAPFPTCEEGHNVARL